MTLALYSIKDWSLRILILAIYQGLTVLGFTYYTPEKLEFDYDTVMILTVYYACSIFFTYSLLFLYEKMAEQSKINIERSLSF